MTNKFSNIKERVLYLAEIQEGNKQNFFKKIDVTYGNFTGKAKETPLNSKTIENILLNYPDVNLYWLITGVGEPLTSQTNVVTTNTIEEFENQKYSNDIELYTKLVSCTNKLEIICSAIKQFTKYKFAEFQIVQLKGFEKIQAELTKQIFANNEQLSTKMYEYYSSIISVAENRVDYYLFILSKYTGDVINDYSDLLELKSRRYSEVATGVSDEDLV